MLVFHGSLYIRELWIVWKSLKAPAVLSFRAVLGFLEKNRDTLSLDLIQLVETSTSKLLKQIFKVELTSNSNTVKSINPRMTINTPRNSLRVNTASPAVFGWWT